MHGQTCCIMLHPRLIQGYAQQVNLAAELAILCV